MCQVQNQNERNRGATLSEHNSITEMMNLRFIQMFGDAIPTSTVFSGGALVYRNKSMLIGK